ncbi:MAG: bifunctional DNA-formamidopyrimidine glycosylase/DNA-(apurinic or apyrimidinic site) lyase [Candidatus Endonucleobacter bathymodioli]|uniref:Formamidopyrimidine-DNA glycosylase n=1 Tax=Candidatus Endonucleibacter bathymodioli TaxID=539814 RepID=A0AA90NUK0_9GAMM|nr:bifunctional DNA-formamidopyrimidine glycosylase/DNA-(apurinic or apyrimidinic site) lyase [Candidatus Endonucleobacter bathymodioli]
MPELPEVETTLRGIAPHIIGQTVKEVVVREHRLRWPVPDDLDKKLAGVTIDHVRRRAKYLLLETMGGTLIIHLGMSGCLRIIQNASLAGKHDHVDIVLSSDLRLRYTDPRKFGSILWTSDSIWEHKLLQKLGPEPLGDDFTGQRLFMMSRRKSQAIKTFIMDSHIVVGIGNIYANETLFKAGILPHLPCGKVSLKRYQVLAESIRTTLSKAIEMGGTTLKDFVGGDGKPGYFQQELSVYGRSGLACKQCGNTISEIRQGNRKTCFCKMCQH